MGLDQYVFKINSVISSSDFSNDSPNQKIFQKSQRKESGIDFGNIFRLACDELKQNQATHTKTRVMTLN